MRDKKTLAERQAAIGDLQIGDYVLVYLTLDGETIETTPDHPFSIAKRAWRPVGELQPDDRIHNAGGTTDWSRRWALLPGNEGTQIADQGETINIDQD